MLQFDTDLWIICKEFLCYLLFLVCEGSFKVYGIISEPGLQEIHTKFCLGNYEDGERNRAFQMASCYDNNASVCAFVSSLLSLGVGRRGKKNISVPVCGCSSIAQYI